LTTVATTINRIKRDYLEPPGEQPSRFVVNDSGGISASDTTLVVSTAMLTAEEDDMIGEGTLLECESELILVTAITGTSPDFTLTIRRGMYGTTAATHADATEIVIAGEDHIPRFSIFTAVADAIEGLWPDLWTVGVEETASDVNPIELPATCGDILNVLSLHGSQWRTVASWQPLFNHPLSSTEIAVQIYGLANGTPIHVIYKKKATRPTLEADTWAALGVEAGWEKVVVTSAVAQLVANRDLNAATVDFITQALQLEGIPPGAGTDIRNALLQFQDFLMRPLKRALPLLHHDRVVIDRQY